MNQPIRTPRIVYLYLGSGFAIGALCMAGFSSGAAVEKAFAGPQVTIKPRLMSSTSTESMTELRNLDRSFRSLARFVGPAVVDIKAESKRAVSAEGVRVPESSGEGSGFLFRPDGYIATNDHVVGTADEVTVTLKDGREFQGKVIRANDVNSDIALVKIEGKDLPYLSFGDSGASEPGEFVMAIGAPFGLENSVTVGHVSALNRSSAIGTHVYTDLLQTDAAINMGNSGGPLVNVDGQVIGMNTAIYSPTGGSNGIGFAIPANQVKLISDLLISKGKIVRSMLGVIPEDVKEYERTQPGAKFPSGGARVSRVSNPSPASEAGLQKDDVIVKIGTTDIRGQLDLRNAMLTYAPGTKVPVEFYRGGVLKTVNLTLKAYQLPKQAPQGPRFPNGQNPFQFDPFNEAPKLNIPPLDEGQGDDSVPPVHEGRAQLGVQVQDLDEPARSQYGIPASAKGAVVATVAPGSVAAHLGLQPGDVVTSLGGKAITSAKGLSDAVKILKWGDRTRIAFTRYDGGSVTNTEREFKFQ